MQTGILDRKQLAAITVGALALTLAFLFTRDMTSSFDSVRYANVAHWLASGDGIATSLTVVPVQEGTPAVGNGLYAFAIQPPGLPLFYALTGVAHRATSHALLHILSYLALAGFVLGLGRQLTGRMAVGLTAAVLTLLSPVLLLTVENIWTDLPTVALSLGALYLLLRSRETDAREWAWLLGASLLAGLAVSLRLTALALGPVLLMDMVLNRRLPLRRQLGRAVSAAGPFGAVVMAILLRNQMLAGSFSGTAPHNWPLATDYNLGRAGSYLGARLVQALVPGWLSDTAAQKLAAINSGTSAWSPAGLLLVVLLVAAVVFAIRRARSAHATATPDAAVLIVTFFISSWLVVLLPAGRHAEFRAVELRYLAVQLPLVWLGIAALVHRLGNRRIAWALTAVLIVVFAAGVPGLHKPYRHNHEYMRQGLDWVRLTIPPETAVLSNGGKVLLDEDLTRRVYHLSDWNFRHGLGAKMRDEAGLVRYLQRHDIRYVVLFGQPDLRQAKFWGKPIIRLFLERGWGPWLAYHDKYLKVYRIPAAGPPPAQP